VGESVINITEQDHNQSNQNASLEYLVRVASELHLPINLRLVTEKEIYVINKSLKWKKSCGYDDTTSRMV
jgi:hypothetical protein